jgi:hypothetical protein
MKDRREEESEDRMSESTNDPMRDMVELLKQQNQTITEILLAQKAEVFGILNTVAETNTMGNVMQHGFATLSAHLAPLRDLTPHRTPLEPEGYARLRNLRASLEREEWGSVQGLEIRQLPVPFIGALPPPRDGKYETVFGFGLQSSTRGAQEGDPLS